MLKLEEYDFPHCVFVFDTTPSEISIKQSYHKCIEHLKIEKMEHVGMTILLTTQYLFIATLSDPYVKDEAGDAYFMDPLGYAGIMNLH